MIAHAGRAARAEVLGEVAREHLDAALDVRSDDETQQLVAFTPAAA